MKHLIALLVALLIIMTAVTVAGQSHQSYVDQAAVQQATAAVQRARQVVAEKAHAAAQAAQTAKAQAEAKRLEAECMKGAAAYEHLSPSQQKLLVKPVCTLQ